MPMSLFSARNTLAITFVAVSATVMLPAIAHAEKKVYTPYVEQGELEVEWLGSYINDDDDAEDGAQEHKLAVGYGFTPHWFSEIYGEVEKSGASGSDFDFTAIEWENRFQLFEPGEYFIDMGLYAAYEVSLEDGGADKAELKLLLGKDVGKFSHYANINFEKELGHNSSEGTEAGFAWSSRYHYEPWLEPGFELHSDFGALNESEPYEEQSHQLGPVIYGKLPQGIKYDIGYLFGVSDAAPDGELKWILEYETKF